MGIMNLLGIGKDIAEPIRAVGDLYTTDKSRIEAEKEYEAVTQQRGLAQLDNNKIMAMSGRFFEAAWQPLCGWTAGFCVALYYIPQLMVADVIWTMNCIDQNRVIPFPIDSGDIINLVYLLFGFGTYHLVKKKILS